MIYFEKAKALADDIDELLREPFDRGQAQDLLRRVRDGLREIADEPYRYWRGFEPSKHPYHDAMKRCRERVQRMTKEEFRDSVVRSGIYNPDGTLTEHYRDKEELEHCPFPGGTVY